MTGILRSIILGVSTAALFGGIAMTCIHTGALREVVRMAVGVMMILALLTPLTGLRPQLPDWKRSPEAGRVLERVEQAKEQQQDQMALSACREVGAYLERKAKAEGVHCEIEVHASMTAENTVSLDSATISAALTAAEQDIIAQILESECGIPRERLSYVED